MRAFSQVRAAGAAISAVVVVRFRPPVLCVAAFCAVAQGTPAIAADLSSLHMKSGLWEIVSQARSRMKKDSAKHVLMRASNRR